MFLVVLIVLAPRVVSVHGWADAHPAAAHVRVAGHQRELGPRREGRHGDDAQQDRPGGHALQALLRGAGRHGERANMA